MAITYKIKSGDTLGAIAKQYGTTVSALASDNKITNPNLIKVGQSLTIGNSSPAQTNVSNYDIKEYRTNLDKTLGKTTTQNQSSNINYTPANSVVTQPKINNTPVNQNNTNINNNQNNAPVSSYSVVAGDSLSKIASKNGMTLQQLLALNPEIQNANMVRVGQTIKLGGNTSNVNNNMGGGNNAPVVDNVALKNQQNEDIAKKAGEAGLSVAEYTNLMNASNTPTKEESDRLAKELGITDLEGKVFAKPADNTQEIYDNAYKESGLATLKSQIDKINKEIEKDRADLEEATATIDENPFLTEASRVGRGKRVLDQAETKINNKLKQIETLQSTYNTGIDEINALITRNTNDFGTNQAIDTAKLNYLTAKAEKQAEQTTAGATAKNVGKYLSSKSASAEPNVIGSAEMGYYKWDTTTRKFVQVLSPKKSSSDETFKPSAEQKALVGRFLSTADGKALMGSSVLTNSDISAIYADPTLFYSLLQKASESGIY